MNELLLIKEVLHKLRRQLRLARSAAKQDPMHVSYRGEIVATKRAIGEVEKILIRELGSGGAR